MVFLILISPSRDHFAFLEKPKRTNLVEAEDIPIEENINRLQIDGDVCEKCR